MGKHLPVRLMVVCAIAVVAWPAVAVHAQSPIITSSFEGNARTGFEENKGQISDQFGRARPDVQFSFVQKGFRMRLLRNGVAYELTQQSAGTDEGVRPPVVDGDVHRPFADGGTPSPHWRRDAARPLTTTVQRVDVGFAGAAAMPRIETGEVLDGYTNYYYAHLPESGATFVRSYASVTYRDLYEGVDMVVHMRPSLDGSAWPVSTDFVVRAGADPTQIRIRYDGARDVRVTAAGELEITTDLGTIREQAPVCRAQLPTGGYVDVGGRYRLSEGEVSFALDAHPAGAILTIDPGLVWATYYGGTGDDRFNDVSSDLSGAVYVVGSTESTSSIATAGAFKTVFGGDRDAMLVKLRSNGTRIWSTYAGGTGDELGHAIATTPGGQAFICGYTTSTTGIATAGSVKTTYDGNEDGFVMRFDSAGVRVFGTYLGGDGQDNAFGISLLGTSGIYIAGSTQSTTGIATSGAFKSTHSGSDTDAFLCLLSWPGSVKIWSTYYGGSSTDFANDVDTDASGNPVMVGRTQSPTGIASSGAHDTTLSGSDGFIARFTSTGSRSWATYFGGSAADEIWVVDVTTSGGIYLCGRTTSPDAIGTPGTHMPTFAGSTSPISMLAAFSSTGTRQWGTYFIGDGCTNIVASGTALYMCGGSRMNTGITTANTWQQNNAGYGDGYLISFSLNGTRNWGTFFGGTDEDDFTSLTLIGGGSNAGDIVCCGLTESAGLSTTSSHQLVGGGKIDGLLTCFRDISITVPALVTTTLCKGSILQVSYTAAGVYASSNIFRAQLSNNTGSFINGVTEIGQRTATSSGTIMGSVPLSPPSTGGYKIRVTSSDPIAYSEPIPATFTLHPTDTSGVTWTGSTSTAWAQYGNWANPCTLPGPGDTVRIPQTTRAPVTSAAVAIGALELNHTGGLTLGGDLTISNKLTLTRGALTLGTHNLVLGTFATIVGGGDSALVVTNSTGSMRSSGRVITRTQFVEFPIGPSLGSYNPLHIINDGTGDEFLARVQSGVTTTGGSGGTAITTDVVGRTWHLAEAVPGGSLLALEFTWKNTHELASFDRRNCFVARYNGRDWVPVSGLDRATGTNPYTREATGLTVTGPFAIGDVQSVIPVELVLFTARVDGADVVLAWETADERTNAGFEVQRARVDEDAWSVVSFVAARAAEGSGAKYEMVDRSVGEGTWRYRLRQVDLDGRAEVSQTVTVVVGDVDAVPVLMVHPNPARDVATVVVRDARLVVLRDVLGREVWRQEIAEGGVQTLVVPTQSLPVGVYIVDTEVARTLLRIVR